MITMGDKQAIRTKGFICVVLQKVPNAPTYTYAQPTFQVLEHILVHKTGNREQKDFALYVLQIEAY